MEEMETQLYTMAWEKWKDMQFIMLFEEMAELQQSVVKFLRGKGELEELHEEIADVQIMLDQMKIKFGEREVQAIKNYKLQRLRHMLEDSKTG